MFGGCYPEVLSNQRAAPTLWGFDCPASPKRKKLPAYRVINDPDPSHRRFRFWTPIADGKWRRHTVPTYFMRFRHAASNSLLKNSPGEGTRLKSL